MRKVWLAMWRSLAFARWSLRRRTGQFVPVAASFVLLVCAAQAIGTLSDVSSVLVQQQIARSWRGSYDLLVRPRSALSLPERGAGWIDSQSLLETYGGISEQQLAKISVTAHVVAVAPVAMVGWQPVDVSAPVELVSQGVYRITATWSNRWASDTVERYVDVTSLTRLVQEQPITNPAVDYLVMGEQAPVYTMTYQAVQAVMGMPATGQDVMAQLQYGAPASAIHLALRVERLRGDLSSLSGCVQRPACWESQQAHQGEISYRVDGVQLLRYSRTQYQATAQQLASGQVSIVPAGSDTQGLLYRTPLTTSVALSREADEALSQQALEPVPFSMPERSSLLAVTPRTIPLEVACAINGASCYSGIYVRLSGAEQYSQRSLALLQATAAAITARTGLHVDILDGSSMRTITLSVQQGLQTMPTLQATWRVVGVAVEIVHGVDALQVTLLVLCSGVCLLSIGMAGMLVGFGRRKDALMLRQLGWQGSALALVFCCDALALCAPGALLVAGWTMIAMREWAGGMAASVLWLMICTGALLYAGALVGSTNVLNGQPEHGRATARVRPPQGSKRVIQLVSNLAIGLAIFLIAEGYALMSGLNEALVVTVLGKQVLSALGGAQLLLLAVIVAAALLTVGFCSTLLLRGRRVEVQLLARIGWERRHVLRRLMRDYCSPALVSGGIGALAAVCMAALLAGTLPAAILLACLIVCGPIAGVLLAAVATIGVAWQETGRVFRWR